MRGTSFVVAPIPEHAFFEQPVLKSQLGHDLFQGGGFRSQVLDLGGGRLPGSIASQSGLPSLQKLLRPRIIQAFGDPLAAAQR